MVNIDWNFINSFAPWLSAIGTLSAVITSLYLAQRDRAIHLKITAGVRVTMSPAIQSRKYIVINITNVGRRSAKVNSIYWTAGILKKKTFYQIHDYENPLSSQLPVHLQDGEEARYPLNMDNEITHWRDLLCESRFPKLQVKFIRVGAYTSTGKRFESRIEQNMQRWLIEQIQLSSSVQKKQNEFSETV